MYESHPQFLSVLVNDRRQRVQADLKRSRDQRRYREERRRKVKERRRP